jgi:mannose-1-phosphate guanylyltransferase/mannose-1-phosphate guanylyltransferase/mannose-6-phosphate isomerase
MFNDCVIMAGGSGTRLWPASNSRKPKQFLPSGDNGRESFFSAAVERALALAEGGDGRVIVIAGQSHLPHVVESCAGLEKADKKRLVLIPEPEAKNTAAAIACAVVFAGLTGGGADRRMLVLTSDHIIRPLERFVKNAGSAAAAAAKDRLAVFGIPPSRPETGYGYIETAKTPGKAPPAGGEPAGGVYPVASFREKPDLKTAKQFTASKRFYWNSGMFAFSARFMAACFRELAPAVIRPFDKLAAPEASAWTVKKGLRILGAWSGLDAAYRQTKNISFDYAIAEQCAQTVMVRADFDWIDVGNWEEYAKLPGRATGDTAEVYRAGGAASCFVDSDIPVALAGTEDLIVVIRSGKDGSPQAALITKKGETQHVREIVEQIKKAGRTDLL